MAFGDLVQIKTAIDVSFGASTLSATFDSSATAGNLIVALYFNGGGTGAVNTSGYTEAFDAVNATESDTVQLHYKVSAGGETTVECGNSYDEKGIILAEFEGPFVSPTALDQMYEEARFSASSVQLGPTSETTQADELALAGIAVRNASATFTFGDSFTERQELVVTGYRSMGLASKVLSATAAIDCDVTISSSYVGTGGIATFKKAASIPTLSLAGVQNITATSARPKVTLTW